jgi:hypothetical protein
MKHFHPGIIAARWARNHPVITGPTLGAIAKLYIALGRKQPHVFDHLAGAVSYLVRVNATLGNGMKINVVWNDTGGQAIWRDGWYEPPTVKVISDLNTSGRQGLFLQSEEAAAC